MNCSEFEIEMQSLVETREKRLSEAAFQHLHVCAECRRCREDHQLINAAVNALPPVQAPAWLIESIMNELAGDLRPAAVHRPVSNARAASREGAWIVGAMVAICLILAICLVGTVERPGGQIVASKATRVAPTHSPHQDDVEVATSVAGVIADLKAEYRELAAETKATARDFAAALPPSVSTVWNPGNSLIPVIEADAEPASLVDGSSPSRTVSNIGHSFGVQVSQAIDFLWIAAPESGPRG